MRIVMTIHYWLDVNMGASGATLQLADAYRSAGHDVDVLSWDDLPVKFTRRTREYGWYAWLAGELARRSRRQGIDIVDCVTADASVWGVIRRAVRDRSLLVARTHGLEHVFHRAKDAARAAGDDTTTRLNLAHEALDRTIAAHALRRADLALFLNDHERDLAVRELGVAASSSAVVPNGIPREFIDLSPPARRPNQPARVAWVGSYDYRKGAVFAASALGRLMVERGDVTATFLGTHHPAEAVHADYPSEVRDRISVVPRFERRDLPDLLRDADVLLFPSLAEGFSLALVEAMACGLAPVASDVGAASAVIQTADQGRVVPSGDADGLLDALRSLVADRDRLDVVRDGAYRRAQGYDWSHAAEANLDAYATAIHRRREARGR